MTKNLFIFISFFFSIILYMPDVYAKDDTIQQLLKQPFLKATFIKQRKLKILSRPFITSGVILFSRDKGVVWQTRTPLLDTLIIKNNGEIKYSQAGADTAAPQNPLAGSASRLFLAILSLDLDKIKEIFTINRGDKEGDVHHYILYPRDRNLAAIIEKIVLSGKSRMEKIDIIEKGGDSTTVSFSNEVFSESALNSADHKLLETLE